MAKNINSKSTKAEILEAYKALEAAYRELEAKQAQLEKAAKKQLPAAVVDKPEEKPQKKEAVTTTKKPIWPISLQDSEIQAQMQGVIQGLEQLGEKFNMALSQLSTHLLVEATRLKDISTTVDLETEQLAALYHLEIEEETLNQLLKQYFKMAEETQEALNQKREEYEKIWLEKNQAWQTEIEETQLRLKEQKESDLKNQQREETEYQYDLSLKQGLNEEKYTQQNKQQQQTLHTLEETQRKAWDEREQVLVKREQQFEKYKAQVENFPKELETTIKKAKEEGHGIARHQAKIKADLAVQEAIGEEEVYHLKIQALEQQVTQQTHQIEKLSQKLEAAVQQAQELAVKAIEGASSHTSFQALKEIALEQAKNQTKTK